MEEDTLILTELRHFVQSWKAPQINLPEVIRWKKYLKQSGWRRFFAWAPAIRKQNSLQHSHSITILGALIVAQLEMQYEIDFGLLMTALTIHDVGEGELGMDTLYIDKKDELDLEEYLAFMNCYKNNSPREIEYLQRAFLLQFALKNPEIFPEDARRIMTELATNNQKEALLFDIIERWDYFLFATEQYLERKNERILIQTLRHQKPHLDRLAKEIPGFGSYIWVEELSESIAKILNKAEGKWIEKKGEK